MTRYLKFKNNVRCPKSTFIVAAAFNARIDCKLDGDCWITSMNDSTHMQDSMHYRDEAADLRTRDLTKAQTAAWAARIGERLGGDYQVIIEKDHIHVEYDPKRPR